MITKFFYEVRVVHIVDPVTEVVQQLTQMLSYGGRMAIHVVGRKKGVVEVCKSIVSMCFAMTSCDELPLNSPKSNDD